MNDLPSSDPEFFDIRYATNRMPWDYGGVPNSLKAFLHKYQGPGSVLIPGCGSGYEIEAFSLGNWDAIGIDFSTFAVARARSVLGPLADKVYEGDFFTHPLSESFFDVIYERAFFCTLAPERRTQYVQRIAKLIAPSGILCGFFFFGPEDEPPPYPISYVQLEELLGDLFEKIEDSTVEDSIALYSGKERWQIWRRKMTNQRH
jgi:Thiopurine S-methyltransferase (TPMT)